MLPEKHILDLIKKYAKTATGKQEIAKKMNGGRFVAEVAKESAGRQAVKQMVRIGNDMKDILFRRISKVIKSFRKEDIIVGKPVRRGEHYTISLNFNQEALRRESLNPDLYPEGVTNIVKLFVAGYDARGAVYGVWAGHGNDAIWSLRHRDPNDFLEKAVGEFNSKYANVAHAETTDEYKTDI